MSLIEAFQAMGNPQGYIGSLDRRSQDTKDMESNRQIYASGYEGLQAPRVTEGRTSGLGQLLQAVGILGEPPSRPLNPYEQYLTDQGARDRQIADLKQEAGALDLSNAKDLAKFNALQRGIKAYEETNTPDPSMMGSYASELDPEYQGAMIQVGEDRKRKTDLYNLQRLGELARIRSSNTTADLKGSIDPDEVLRAKASDQAAKILNSSVNAPLKRQYMYFEGDPQMGTEGAFAKAERTHDPLEVSKVMEGDQWGGGYRRLYQQLVDAFIKGGIRPDIAANIIRVPGDPNEGYGQFGRGYGTQAEAATGRKGLSADAWGAVIDSVPDVANPPDPNTQSPYRFGNAGPVPWNRSKLPTPGR